VAKQTITVELDDETIACLITLGNPAEALARLADSMADAVCHANAQRRALTDESLRVERDKADTDVADELWAASELAQIARRGADKLVLEREQAKTAPVLAQERAARKADRSASMVVERAATDMGLSRERSDADLAHGDQREANEHMVNATMRAQELAAEADAARARAERSERELREVAEFREMFIGMLGHDLRNPLGSIVMAAGAMLQRGNLDTRDAETIARIIRASHRITRMITQLLDLTRARLGGGLPIEPTPVDLREICRNVIEELDAPIELEVEGDVTGAWDEGRVAEVLSNLMANAIDYATPGTQVIVKARADGPEVVVEITNQGDPIPADVLPFIFEPFRQGKPRAKLNTGNLGLGLYIAQQIVLAHRGTIAARSAGGTTTFELRLPRLAP
jgi:signal transduction histidine kinase